MRQIDADSLKENGFVVPKTFKKGDVYLEVKAEDMATETAPVRRFFINDKIIDAIPTIEAEPVKHGRWQPFDLTWGRNIYACTSCGQAFEVPTEDGKPIYDYCPNCGAVMDAQEVE